MIRALSFGLMILLVENNMLLTVAIKLLAE